MNKKPSRNAARIQQGAAATDGKDSRLAMEVVLDIPIEIAVKAGSVKMTVGAIGRLKAGAVLQLDTLAGQPVDLLANGHWIGQGELVLVDERYGVRITRIGGSP
jgi:flagellar motor switch protein FliN/FliY